MGRRLAVLLSLLLFANPAGARQAGKWAVVETSTAFMRVSADYTSGLDNQMLMGAVVRVLDSDRYWDRVEALEPAYTGWVNHLQLAETEDINRYIRAPKWICTTDHTHVWSTPDAMEPVCDLILNDLLRQTGEASGDMVKVLLPSGRQGWARASELEDFASWADARQKYSSPDYTDGRPLVEFSRRFLGTPYMWGGASVKHFDCSGLVRTVYFNFGILLPRDASQMVRRGRELPLDMESWRPGDLLFFGRPASGDSPLKVTHVAMYMGEGRIIHSSQLVRINTISEGEADSYNRSPIAARRILGEVGCDSGIGVLRTCDAYFR